METHQKVKAVMLAETPMLYVNNIGQRITVIVVEDCGNMKDKEGSTWRKVICRPIGFNNTIPMTLDFNNLTMEGKNV